jgi:hypothetical protein
MKYLALLLLSLSLPALADSIQFPSTGYVWVDRNPANLSQVAYTVSNLGYGEYTPTEEIYSLQFGDITSQYLFYKLGDVAYTGTFSDWSFQDGSFSGIFTGTELDFYSGTWSIQSMTAIDGIVSQQLSLIPGCYGDDNGCGTIGAGSLTLSGNEVAAVPEPESWMLAITSGVFVALVFGRKPALFRA